MTAVADTKDPSPAAPYYRVVGRELDVARAARDARLPILLKGPTGCGKSRLVEALAAEAGRPLITVACNEETSAVDLLGRHLVHGGDTVWQDGPVTRAVRTGAFLYLDEVAEAREDVIVVLHPLADHRRQLFVDRTNELLTAAAGFQLLVSFNPGYQRGLADLKPSTRQRFVAIGLTYPAPRVEAEIVGVEAGVEPAIAKRLVAYGQRIRALDELGLAETVSTRLLVAAGQLVAGGLDPRLACGAAIVHTLTDDPEVAAALQDAADLTF